MAAFTSMLGDTLQCSTGPVATTTALAGKKAVGLYFSAHVRRPAQRTFITIAIAL